MTSPTAGPPSPAAVRILGAPTVVVGGCDRAVGGRQALLLLALALEPNRMWPTDTLIARLWPEDPPAVAGNALQALVSRLRKILPGELRLDGGAAGYRLVADPDAVDLHQFRRLAREADDIPTLTRALDLVGGPLGAGLTEVPFLHGARATVAEEHRAVARRLAWLRLAVAGPDPLLPELTAAARESPLDAGWAELLMTALHRAARQVDALAAYDRHREALAEETGLDPAPALTALRQRILVGEPEPVAPEPVRAQVDRRTAALPRTRSRLIGRAVELARLIELLGAEHVVVTLLGPGGVGKTRLAIEAGIRLATTRDVVFVDLAAARDEDSLLDIVADGCGLALVSARDRRARTAEQLAQLDAVVVLDNAEHVEAACAALLDEVAGLRGRARFLVTSRVRLQIEDEVEFPLRPLTCADTDGVEGDAEALFAERAARALPGGSLPEPVLREICRRLDGLPLALEIAAAQLRVVSATELLTHVRAGAAQLTGDRTAGGERHRSIEATIGWGYALLPVSARDLLRTLGIFDPSADLAGLAALAGRPTAALLADLRTLVDHSLVLADPGPRGTRYRLLQTVRDFAVERLREHGELDRVTAGHRVHFTELVAASYDDPANSYDEFSLEFFEADADNYRAALSRSLAAGDFDQVIRLAMGFSQYWNMRALQSEAFSWSEELAERVPLDAPGRGRLLSRLAVLCNLGHPRALEWLREAVGLLAAGGPEDRGWLARARCDLGWLLGYRIVAGATTDPAGLSQARALVETAMTDARAVGDERLELFVLATLATPEINEDYDLAATLHLECARRYRALGRTTETAIELVNAAGVEMALGRSQIAAQHATESMALASAHVGMGQHALCILAICAFQAGQVDLGVNRITEILQVGPAAAPLGETERIAVGVLVAALTRLGWTALARSFDGQGGLTPTGEWAAGLAFVTGPSSPDPAWLPDALRSELPPRQRALLLAQVQFDMEPPAAASPPS